MSSHQLELGRNYTLFVSDCAVPMVAVKVELPIIISPMRAVRLSKYEKNFLILALSIIEYDII